MGTRRAYRGINSRAIQLAIKYATPPQKGLIMTELTGHFVELSQEQYGHYVVLKLLAHDTHKGDGKKLCFKEFRGNVTKVSCPFLPALHC